eukprot:CAMPEP_0174700848 /NCGR_PEP_ID=MMETSP1094-20130205/5677_1 /TAXON_ID=156173 /ORGANISM="Chrysochromulina brevifilum, Strain UTEX LB 985" /LENGTH=78 /DNA_ID=CAMNT_0015898403 /DNA_START=292 /DNA_END=529 /DNA_ORIENTATION=+
MKPMAHSNLVRAPRLVAWEQPIDDVPTRPVPVKHVHGKELRRLDGERSDLEQVSSGASELRRFALVDWPASCSFEAAA